MLGVAASLIPGIGGHAGEASQLLGMLHHGTGQQPVAQQPVAQQPVGQQPQARPGQADYDQARAACLSGRGYSVR
jgi:hypothetical protein